jgi:ankyrin repeat protein
MKLTKILCISVLFLTSCNNNSDYSDVIKFTEHVVGGNVKAVKLYLENQVDVNANVSGGLTPLMYAAGAPFMVSEYDRLKAGAIHTSTSNIVITEALIAAGAMVDQKDNTGNTALHYAIYNYRLDLVWILAVNGASFDLEDNDGETGLTIAQDHGYDEILRMNHIINAR